MPLRPPNAHLNENGSLAGRKKAARLGAVPNNPTEEEEDPTTLALRRRELSAAVMQAKRVPMAKRTHMDGVLHGMPLADPAHALHTTQQDALEYTDEMQTMNRDKNTQYHRKRDAYSDYVEARARFSKMHSVN
ncbi:hypothetical protein PINS_up002479 [Pythium insidiosum]|nr:hypothetical protein PINS_up002479 [Pythium insidiosum]